MGKARTRQDYREWTAAHDAELDIHDAELRTWTYEESIPTDRPVPYTMTYEGKKNQFGVSKNTRPDVPFKARA